MTPSTPRAQDANPRTLLSVLGAVALIVAALAAAYANSLGGSYLFDDVPSIPDNPTIRHLGALGTVLNPPHGEGITVEGRPILNLSFAINFALGGTAVQGYHVVNLLIHVAASLFLFGIVRRILRGRSQDYGADATGIACLCALVWGLHPLQTESVSYVVQRAESLMGCFYLAALYSLTRGAERDSSGWYAACAAFAFLCAATKEVAVTLPVIVILFDRTFIAGSFKAAWSRRKALYLALASSWILVISLALSAGDRGGTIGTKAGVSPWAYALSQSRGIFHYLRLSVWPHPLILDYGTNFVSFGEALPWATALIVLIALSVIALRRRPVLGFFGAWFLVILAPTSSFVGGTRQMLAEHRMYLPLAAIAVGFVVALYRLLGRRGLLASGLVCVALAAATAARNEAYHDNLSIYRDTVEHRPQNAWAHYNLAKTLDESGDPAAAMSEYALAVALDPGYYQAHFNWGNSLSETGRYKEAELQFEAALRIRPTYPKAEYNLGNVLVSEGRLEEAAAHFREAVRQKPDYLEAQDNYATALLQLGRPLEAINAYRASLRIDPEAVAAHYNLGGAYLAAGRLDQAIEQYGFVLAREPDMPEAHYRMGNALEAQGQLAQAIEQYQTAIRLRPGDPQVQADLDRAQRALR